MDYTQPQFWIALVAGGVLIATFSAVQQWYANQSSPDASFSVRPVLRDFCIGSFLTSIIYMFVPESITNWIDSSQKLLSSYTTSSSKPSSSTQSGGSEEFPRFEIKTGPARF